MSSSNPRQDLLPARRSLSQIEALVEHYYETLLNVTPADTYLGRTAANIQLREMIKRQTIEIPRLQHSKIAT